MIGEGPPCLDGARVPITINWFLPLLLSITVLSHTRMRFHPCTGRQSRIVLSPLPRLFIINRIHTMPLWGTYYHTATVSCVLVVRT